MWEGRDVDVSAMAKEADGRTEDDSGVPTARSAAAFGRYFIASTTATFFGHAAAASDFEAGKTIEEGAKQARGATRSLNFNLKWSMNPFASFPWPPSYSLT